MNSIMLITGETRSIIQKLIEFKDTAVVKIITGLKHSGKTSLIEAFQQYLKYNGVNPTNIIYMSFKTLENCKKTFEEILGEILSKITSEKTYIFLEDIQRINNWELIVLHLSKANCDLYIIGSNAYLLSPQLLTNLSDKYIEIKILPFSFKEFISFNFLLAKMKDNEQFDIYLKFGGIPSISIYYNNIVNVSDNNKENDINSMLEGIFSIVIMENIIKQTPVRDIALLEKIIIFLANNIGNNISSCKIKKALMTENNSNNSKITMTTIDHYIKLLENAFIFYPIVRYDVKKQEYLKTQKKYYIVDLGLRNQLLGYKNIHKGRVLENVVYFELLHRGYKVSIGKIGNKEIDFIATKADTKLYIQVAETLSNEEIMEKELAPLCMFKDFFEKIILTNDKISIKNTKEGIKIINLIDWLKEYEGNNIIDMSKLCRPKGVIKYWYK